MKTFKHIRTWLREVPGKDWYVALGVLVGLIIILSAVVLVYRLIDDKDDTIRTVRAAQDRASDQTLAALTQAHISDTQARLAEARSDRAITQIRKERAFYDQVECASTQSVNQFISVVSHLILDGNAPLTPEDRALLIESSIMPPLPERCRDLLTSESPGD